MTYNEAHRSNAGKVSDKWSLYLSVYSDIFGQYESKDINYFEIGVQNGGSLDIAASYFKNAKNIVGCDINPSCSKLKFSDSRIKLLIGDANSEEIYSTVTETTRHYDIIIDDGSHTSSDIIKSFVKYFPLIQSGGVFIAEDLHCSYWNEFQGGLHDPDSSISFFKLLSDVVNHEHWGINRSRREHLTPILSRLGIDCHEDTLAEIHSVTFFNSLCIIRKQQAAKNSLGERVISGTQAQVLPEITSLNRTSSPLIQTSNPWSVISQSPMFEYRDIYEDLRDKGIILRSLRDHVQRQEELINLANIKVKQELEKQSSEYKKEAREATDRIRYLEGEIVKLRDSISGYSETLANRDLFINNILKSTSWKLSAPLRITERFFRKFLGHPNIANTK